MKLMANRSDRRFPNLAKTWALQGRMDDEAKTRGFYWGQGEQISPQMKAG
jgi:hypothetical protein